MYVTPVGFLLFPLAIWLLWQASKIATYRLTYKDLHMIHGDLKRRDAFYGGDEANKFLLGRKKIIYRGGLFILASLITFFCFVFFTIKTPDSNYRSPAWAVASLVFVYYGTAIVGQFVLPLLDLKQLQFDEVALLKLDD
jgi:hypothetical protein